MTRPRFAICNEIFNGWKFEETCAYAARLGYSGLEIAPYTLADSVLQIGTSERERIKVCARDHHLEIAGIHWLLVKPEGLYLNHPDGVLRAKTSRYFCDLVRFCADIGGKIMVVGSPKQRNLLPGCAPDEAWAWGLETFRDPVRVAEEKGVTICLEPLAPSETNFINTAAEAIRFIEQIHSPAFRLILDVKAMSSESLAIPEIVRRSRDYLAHFHANDPNLKGPGFGQMDFLPIAAALREINYRGYVSVEVFKFDEGAERIAIDSLRYLQRVFGPAGLA